MYFVNQYTQITIPNVHMYILLSDFGSRLNYESRLNNKTYFRHIPSLQESSVRYDHI